MLRNTRTNQFEPSRDRYNYNTNDGTVESTTPPPWCEPAIPFVCPAGHVLIAGTQGAHRDNDGIWWETWQTEPANEYQDRVKAESDRAEAERLAGLAIANVDRLVTIAGLLSVFGLTMPCSTQEAQTAAYMQSKADPTKAADGVLMMRLWDEFEKAVAEPDRLAVIALVKGGVA